MPAQPSSRRRPSAPTGTPGLSRWARHLARGRPAFVVLDELDFLLLAADDGLRRRTRSACEDGYTALDRAVARQDPGLIAAARDASGRAASIAGSVGGDRLAVLATARDDALRVLSRRGVLGAEPAAVAARSAPGTAALAYAITEVELSGARRGVHRVGHARPVRGRRPVTAAARPDPTAVDPGAAAGVALVAVAIFGAVAVLAGTLPASAAVWGSTLALFGGTLALAASGGRVARSPNPGRLTSRHLTGTAALGGVSTVLSTIATVSDPLTGRYVGLVLWVQAMSVVGIASLATRVRRAERHRRR